MAQRKIPAQAGAAIRRSVNEELVDLANVRNMKALVITNTDIAYEWAVTGYFSISRAARPAS